MVGPLRVTQALLPLLLKKDTRKVINISSTLGSISTHRWAFASCLVDQSASIIAYERPWCLRSDSLTVNQKWGCPSWDTCSFCTGNVLAQHLLQEARCNSATSLV